MAKQLTSFGKFLLIECTAGELMNSVGSDICICDWCGKSFFLLKEESISQSLINGTA